MKYLMIFIVVGLVLIFFGLVSAGFSPESALLIIAAIVAIAIGIAISTK